MSGTYLRSAIAAPGRIMRRRDNPGNPDTGVRVPVRRGPGGRGAAVALEEPRHRKTPLDAISRRRASQR